MSNDYNKNSHSVQIEDRKAIELSGVSDVPSFNEDEVLIVTDYGDVIIKGCEMKLEALDLDNGTVKINGKITALIYNEKSQVKGFFKRAFSS